MVRVGVASFIQNGVKITQHADHSFTPDQPHYVDTIGVIQLGHERRQHLERRLHLDRTLTSAETSQIRSVIGGLLWNATQTGMVIIQLCLYSKVKYSQHRDTFCWSLASW